MDEFPLKITVIFRVHSNFLASHFGAFRGFLGLFEVFGGFLGLFGFFGGPGPHLVGPAGSLAALHPRDPLAAAAATLGGQEAGGCRPILREIPRRTWFGWENHGSTSRKDWDTLW